MPRPTRRKAAASTATKTATVLTARASTTQSSGSSQKPPAQHDTTSDHDEGLSPEIEAAEAAGSNFTSGALPTEEPLANEKVVKSRRPLQRKGKNRVAKENEASNRAIEALRARMGQDKAKNNPTLASLLPPKTKTHIDPPPPATLQVQRSVEEPDSEAEAARPKVPGSAWKRTSAAPMSVRKPMSTPRAEASMMALANFKRRSRAPSLLGIGNQDDTMSINSDGSFGDLVPDDESTPLPQMRAQPGRTPVESPSSVTDAQTRGSLSRKRKRGSHDLLVPNSQPEAEGLAQVLEPSREDAVAISPADPDSSDIDLPELDVEEPEIAPGTPSSTMAPPQSSSSINQESQANPPVSSPLKSRKSKLRAAADSGIAANWNRKKSASNRAEPVDTALLQDMLPRRRRHRHAKNDEFNVWSSDGPRGGDGDDEHDVSTFHPRKRRGTNADARSRPILSEKNTQIKGRKNGKKGGQSLQKAETPTGKAARTYSRRQSDKENVVSVSSADHGDSSSEVENTVNETATAPKAKPAKSSKELKALARKFAEVDSWEMDFEEVTENSDVLKNAR